jgi:hypothetical protein
MRNIRTAVNKAIVQKLLPADQYPFKGYTIPSGQNIKKGAGLGRDTKAVKLSAYE